MTRSTPSCRFRALSKEERAQMEALGRQFLSEYAPRTAAERVILEELIGAAQRLFHLNRIEQEHLEGEPDLRVLGQISRQRTAASSTFHRSRKLLDACYGADVRVEQPAAPQEFITTSEKVMNVEPAPDPLAALIESYRAAHPDDPDAAYRVRKAQAHLDTFRSHGQRAQLRRELVAILHPAVRE